MKMEQESGNKKWFALYVNSRAEKKVADSLTLKGVEIYLPLIESVRQWSDRKKKIVLPLFNGYVFVHINATEKEKVLQTNGVVNFVRHCGKDAEVRNEEIVRLKQLIELGYTMDAGGIEKAYNKGDRVRIKYGPLKNLEGYILDDASGRFVEVVLESIGQVLKVKLMPQLITEIVTG